MKASKLYVLPLGGFFLPKNTIAPHAVNGDVPVHMPIHAYLIQHPTYGNILVDTGQDYSLADENAVGTEADSITVKLAELGLTPDDISYIILSHMHLDHCGNMMAFPNATFVVRREEMKAAWWPEPCEVGYVYELYKDARNFKYIQLEDDVDYDLFMDGSIVLIDTRGHSRGHQSVVVDLEETGKVLLICDAASLKENLDRTLLPGTCTNNWDAMHSMEKLRQYRRCGCKLFFMHDPDEKYRLAPEYYK